MATARDTVYETLRERLLAGFYAEGEPLIPQGLSLEFNVSRTPVREALGLLEQGGLLSSTTRGFVIRQRSEAEMLEIFEVRGILESSAAGHAAVRRNELDLVRLREFHQGGLRATDPTEARRAFNAFHEALRMAAHNSTVYALLQTVGDQVKLAAPWHTAGSDAELAESHESHATILEAIEAGDSELARSAMLEHLARDRDVRVSQFMARTQSR